MVLTDLPLELKSFRIRSIHAALATVVGIFCLGSVSWAQAVEGVANERDSGLTQVIASLETSSDTGVIALDGRPLYTIAVPESADSEGLPLRQRITMIEANLRQAVATVSDPQALEIQIETQSNLPVLSLNNQYLMTVTTLDAQLQGVSPQARAIQIEEILQDALATFYRERQPAFLLSRGLMLGGLGLTTFLISLGLERYFRQLESERETVSQHLKDLAAQAAEVTVDPETGLPDNQDTYSQLSEDKALRQQQLSSLMTRQRLLRVGQWVIWSGSLTIGLGFLPYTRGVQLLVLRSIQGPIFKVVQVGVAIAIANRMGGHLVDRLLAALKHENLLKEQSSIRLNKRLDTFADVAKGSASAFVFLVGGLTGLALLGVSVGPLLASLGFIGLGISLAGQDIIKDVMNGLLILAEDQYAEGDVVMVNAEGGLVENLNLRITQLRNSEGTLITIPNGAIRMVKNLSNGWSRVDLAIDVAYSTDLDRAMQVIEQVARHMSYETQWRDKIVEPPAVQGVDDFGPSAITIRIWIKVKPLQQWAVAREYRRRLKQALDRAGISIPFPQQEIWFRSTLDITGSNQASNVQPSGSHHNG